mmetsp:Transcript_73290/g.157010  ORF Transcript_73290/g.157010 Transcript_73290/m.157010 type:complete len:359 (-) Transcript_73290:3691-4767(-)
MPIFLKRTAPSDVSKVSVSSRIFRASRSVSTAPSLSPDIHFVTPMEDNTAKPSLVRKVPALLWASLAKLKASRALCCLCPPMLLRGTPATLDNRLDLSQGSELEPARMDSWSPSWSMAAARGNSATSRKSHPNMSHTRAAGSPSSSEEAKSLRACVSAAATSPACKKRTRVASTVEAPAPSLMSFRRYSFSTGLELLAPSACIPAKTCQALRMRSPPPSKSAVRRFVSAGGMTTVSSQALEPKDKATIISDTHHDRIIKCGRSHGAANTSTLPTLFKRATVSSLNSSRGSAFAVEAKATGRVLPRRVRRSMSRQKQQSQMYVRLGQSSASRQYWQRASARSPNATSSGQVSTWVAWPT